MIDLMNSTFRHRTFLVIGVFALALFAVGCSDDATAPDAGEDISGTNSLEEIDLDKAYGGLAYTDEEQAFGDSALLAEALVEDQMATSEDDEDSVRNGDPTLDDPNLRRTFLRILWGQLGGEPTLTAVNPDGRNYLDWSGTLSVSEGAVFLKKTILFERPFDHRLPRDSRQSLGWHSLTGPHFDGILVCIISPVDESGAPMGEVTFSTELLEQTYSIAELQGLDERIAVDAIGNAVSFTGHVPDPDACAQGFLAGYWHNLPGPVAEIGVRGAFRGRYVTEDGRLVGFLMGRYGVNSEGERVFAGKIIGRHGAIKGLLGGTWQPADENAGMGSFQGRWVGRFGNHHGTLQGRYEAAPRFDGAGFFKGMWQESCAVDEAA